MLEWRTGSAFGPVVTLEHITRVDNDLGLPVGTWARFELWEKQAAGDVDDALRRRYAVPFATTNGIVDITKVPDKVKKWVQMLLDSKLLDARREAGTTGPDDSNISKLKEEANAEMAKAADANESPHPELPLRSDLPSTSGVTLGGPMVTANNTIYGFFDGQQYLRDQEGW
jgi:hypothetical protein